MRALGETMTRFEEVSLTVLLAEKNAKFVLKLSHYGYIIGKGRICYQGTVKELLDDEEVRRTCGL